MLRRSGGSCRPAVSGPDAGGTATTVPTRPARREAAHRHPQANQSNQSGWIVCHSFSRQRVTSSYYYSPFRFFFFSYTYGFEASDGSFRVETRDIHGNVKGKYG